MLMHDVPHPGEFIKFTYLAPYGLSVRFLAKSLKVAPSTINRLVRGEASVSPEMAHRLSIVLGRSPESWLLMQSQYDLCVTKKPKEKLRKIDFAALRDAA